MKADNEQAILDCNAVKSMINSRGWMQVVRPALEARMNAFSFEFSSATKLEDFIRIQQSINALSGLLSFIEVKLSEGNEALKEETKTRKDSKG